MKAYNRKQRPTLSTIPAIILFFMLVTNRVQYGATYLQKVAGILSILTWLFICLIEKPRIIIRLLSSKTALLLYVSLVIRFLEMALSTYGIVNSIEYIAGRIGMYVPLLIFSYYREVYELDQLKKQICVALVIWFAVIVGFFVDINFDSSISRNIINGTLDRGLYGATIDLAVGSAIIAVSVLSARYTVKTNLRYWLILSSLIVFFFYQGYITQSFIAISVGIIGLVLELFLPTGKEKTAEAYLTGLAIFAAIFCLFIFHKGVGYFLIENAQLFQGSIFEEKLIETGYSLAYGLAIGDVSIRSALYAKSLKTFLENPLFGTVFLYGYNSATNTTIGFHSGLDLFARFGLLASIPLITALLLFIRNNSEICCAYKSVGIWFIIVIYFVLANWDHVEGFFALFYLAPMITYVMVMNDNNRKREVS